MEGKSTIFCRLGRSSGLRQKNCLRRCSLRHHYIHQSFLSCFRMSSFRWRNSLSSCPSWKSG